METFPYRIERLSDDRLADVQRLLREVLRKRVPVEWVRHKYDTRYTGVQYMAALAYRGDRPIAFYGTIPQYFVAPDGQRWIGAHLADCMTLDAYQRQGIHRQLGLAIYDWMRQEGVKVIYGFHSENTYYSSKKLGWAEWGSLRGYWVQAARWPTAKLWRRLPGLRSWQEQRLTHAFAPHSIRDFANSHAGLGLAVEYSPAFLASKQFQAQFWVELAGVKFWLSVDAVVRVGDAHFADHAHFLEGLNALRSISSRLGYGQILFQTYAGSSLDVALSSAGSTPFESWRVGYLALSSEIDFRAYRPGYADQDSF